MLCCPSSTRLIYNKRPVLHTWFTNSSKVDYQYLKKVFPDHNEIIIFVENPITDDGHFLFLEFLAIHVVFKINTFSQAFKTLRIY